MTAHVTPVSEGCLAALQDLLGPLGLRVQRLAPGEPIPGTYWGAPEAGLVGSTLYLAPETPLHSALHEACHYLCMDPARRAALHRDAGGDIPEENAVCYLQVLLADRLPGVGRERMFRDMDAWGYTFRLGSTRRWFEEDADDAREWLARRGLLAGCGVAPGPVAAGHPSQGPGSGGESRQ